jgi:hypothetical protein
LRAERTKTALSLAEDDTNNYQTKYLEDTILQKKNTTLSTYLLVFYNAEIGFAQYTIPKAPTLQTSVLRLRH